VVTTLESAPLYEAHYLIDELRRRSYPLGLVVANRALDPALVARAAADCETAAVDRPAFVAALATAVPPGVAGGDVLARVATEVVATARRMVERAGVEHVRLMALVAGSEGAAVLRAPLQSTDVTALDDLVRLQREFVPVAIV
jgi:hypothetical protein